MAENLKIKLMQDLKQAMRDKEKFKKSVIQLLLADYNSLAKEQGRELSDEEALTIVQRQYKQTKEALDYAEKADRDDLVDEANIKLDYITELLPEQLNEEQIRDIVEDTIASLGVEKSMKSMGRVMGAVMPKVKGKADGNVVSRIVKEELSQG